MTEKFKKTSIMSLMPMFNRLSYSHLDDLQNCFHREEIQKRNSICRGNLHKIA